VGVPSLISDCYHVLCDLNATQGVPNGETSDAPVRRLSASGGGGGGGKVDIEGNKEGTPGYKPRKRTRTIKKETGKLIIRLRQLVAEADGDPNELYGVCFSTRGCVRSSRVIGSHAC
jgi:hypothetical protein